MGIVVALLFCVACSPAQAFDWDNFQSSSGTSSIQQSSGFSFSAPASAVSNDNWNARVNAVGAAYRPAAVAPAAAATVAPTVYIVGLDDPAKMIGVMSAFDLKTVLTAAQSASSARAVPAGTSFSLQASAIGGAPDQTLHLSVLSGAIGPAGFNGFVLNKDTKEVFAMQATLMPRIDITDDLQSGVAEGNNIHVSLTATQYKGEEGTITSRDGQEITVNTPSHKDLQLTLVYSPGSVQPAADGNGYILTASTSYAVDAKNNLYRIDNAGDSMCISAISLDTVGPVKFKL